MENFEDIVEDFSMLLADDVLISPSYKNKTITLSHEEWGRFRPVREKYGKEDITEEFLDDGMYHYTQYQF